MTLLTPTKIYKAWQEHAKTSNKLLVQDLCQLRDLLSDCEHSAPMRLQYKKEFCRAYGYAMETLRDYLGKIRKYPFDLLMYWIDSGLTFDHLEKANTHAAAKKMTPKALLDFAVTGNENGDVMTVDEMVSFALGEQETPAKVSQAKRMFVKAMDWLGKVPQRAEWDDNKTGRYAAWVKAGWEFWE